MILPSVILVGTLVTVPASAIDEQEEERLVEVTEGNENCRNIKKQRTMPNKHSLRVGWIL
jgi:hypothetical protein